MASNHRVIWTEGLFLQPQHFQQQERFFDRQLDARLHAVTDHGWGFSELRLDSAALALGKIVVERARGVLPDGTPFSIPDQDSGPPPLDFPADLKDSIVLLALPLTSASRDAVEFNVDRVSSMARLQVTEEEVTDQNGGYADSALLQLGELRLHLLLERDHADSFVTLGVLRVVERRADNTLVLDRDYLPPSLSCRACQLATFADEIHGLLHQRGVALAARLTQPGRGGIAEIVDFLFLQTVNRFEPLLKHLTELGILHPERLYSVLLALAGELSTYREARRPIDYPVYYHDALERSFLPLMQDLRASLSLVIESSAISIELQERGHGVRVAVVADRDLLLSASFVLAVNAQMPGEALRGRFPTQVKLGPVEKLRDLVNLALPGIGLRVLPVAPRQIPYHAGYTYFELDRSGELWKAVEKSGSMAMHIAGDFPGLELECWAIRD